MEKDEYVAIKGITRRYIQKMLQDYGYAGSEDEINAVIDTDEIREYQNSHEYDEDVVFKAIIDADGKDRLRPENCKDASLRDIGLRVPVCYDCNNYIYDKRACDCGDWEIIPTRKNMQRNAIALSLIITAAAYAITVMKSLYSILLIPIQTIYQSRHLKR